MKYGVTLNAECHVCGHVFADDEVAFQHEIRHISTAEDVATFTSEFVLFCEPCTNSVDA